jgi:hypothetical protein
MSAPEPKSQDLDPIESAFDISLRRPLFEGFSVVRARGRAAMPKAYKKLGLPALKSAPDTPSQPDLFKVQPWI